MTPLTEKQYIDLKRFHTRVRLHWDKTQPSDRFPMALVNAKRFFSSEEMPNLDEGKLLYFHLKSLAIWLKKMDEYQWSEENK